MTEEIGGLNEGMERIENRIEKMRSRMASDSLINRKHVVIDTLKTALNLLKERQRALFAEPLAESFQEGFELLSRKSDRINEVKMNPETYSMELTLDRDTFLRLHRTVYSFFLEILCQQERGQKF